jgi:predicted TIM-barrel fold metal-dependent hydrolase
LLVEEAVAMGIGRIIVTHPIYQRIAMPLEVQQELARKEGVYIEQCYSMYFIDDIPIKDIAMQIKAVGAEKCLLTSDMGQVNSPAPSVALRTFADLLKEQGLNEQELREMGEVNPRKLLGLT